MNEINFDNLASKVDCLLDKYITVDEKNMALRQQLAKYTCTIAKLEALLTKIKEELHESN
jgi:hypothetical protein